MAVEMPDLTAQTKLRVDSEGHVVLTRVANIDFGSC